LLLPAVYLNFPSKFPFLRRGARRAGRVVKKNPFGWLAKGIFSTQYITNLDPHFLAIAGGAHIMHIIIQHIIMATALYIFLFLSIKLNSERGVKNAIFGTSAF